MRMIMLIKICGLTKVTEADYLNANHVDFAGFVLFFPKSKRNITIEQAKEIMAHLNATIKKVAVVVKPDLAQIQQIEAAGFDYIQIHSDIAPTLLEQIQLPILKAFNVNDIDTIDRYRSLKNVAGYVFDAHEPGSGKSFDWSMLSDIPRDNKLFFLAGGISADNVKEAIKKLSPDGIDVSTGVEYNASNKTGKDPQKIEEFVRIIRTEQKTYNRFSFYK